jgi:uncharacterized protein (PEP-CTERM system associated)
MLKLAPLALAATMLSAECRADWIFKPTASLRETYTDNLGLQRDDAARNAFITEASSGFTLTHAGPRLSVSASAQGNVYEYSDKDVPNLYDGSRRYQASARAMVVDDLFYVDANAGGQHQAISAFGQLSDSPYSSLNNTDVRSWRISPYLQHRFGSTATAVARFTRDSVEAGAAGFGGSKGSTSTIDVVSGPDFSRLGWSVNLLRQDLSNRISGSSSTQTGMFNLRYRAIPTLNLTASAGYDDYEYAALNDRTSGANWSLGFAWTPSTRSSVQASFGHRYFGKTGALTALHRTRNTVWTFNYSDQITTSRSQFTLPAAIDTAAMLDRLFAASFPDAVQRQQAVQAYIAATGLPASLADSVNYLSNRYIRAKHLQAGAVMRGARTTLAAVVYGDDRNALSLQQSDSTLLGSQLGTLNDSVRQVGASIDANYRLSTRNSAHASVDVTRARSVSANVVNNSRQYRVGLARRVSTKTTASVDLQRARGTLVFPATGDYHANSIAATLTVQF